MIRHLLLILLTACLTFGCRSSKEYLTNPDYRQLKALAGDTLRQVLNGYIDNHKRQSYKALWTHFEQTDLLKQNYIWDIYASGKRKKPQKQAYVYQLAEDQCGNFRQEGDCYNREHAFPKSWWGGDRDTMYTDLFHIYPTDGYVNQVRSNHPYGETNQPDVTTQNGSKRGPSSLPSYQGTVFEPIDPYKGDVARAYFYMLTRYANRVTNWESPMLEGDDLAPWAREMLIRWHKTDPVSKKEKLRNRAIYQVQGNYNPFVLHPNWVYKIWGNVPQ